MPDKIEYVLGFAFNKSGDEVLLIEKKRPKWQEGLKNGIGGKKEKREAVHEAMVREFKEETGVDTKEFDWSFRAILEGRNFKVYVFKTNLLDPIFNSARTVTDEEIVFCEVNNLIGIVDNLNWLIPIVKDEDIVKVPTFVLRS